MVMASVWADPVRARFREDLLESLATASNAIRWDDPENDGRLDLIALLRDMAWGKAPEKPPLDVPAILALFR